MRVNRALARKIDMKQRKNKRADKSMSTTLLKCIEPIQWIGAQHLEFGIEEFCEAMEVSPKQASVWLRTLEVAGCVRPTAYVRGGVGRSKWKSTIRIRSVE